MASGDQYAQLAVEASPNGETGTASVSSTVFYHPLESMSLKATPITDDRTDEFRGTAEPLPPDITGFQLTQGQAVGRLYPNVIGAYLTAMLGYVAPVQGNGSTTVDPSGGTVPAGAYMHTWNSGSIDPATIRSMQIKRAFGNNSGVFIKDTGVTVTQLDLAIGDQSAPSTFTAALSGLYQARISDPSLTASYDATTIKPFYRGNFSVASWLASTTSPIGASMSFTNPVEPDPVLNSSLWPSSWTRPNQAGAVPRLTGTIDGRSVDADDYDAFIANTGFTYLMKWVSTQAIGTSTYHYSLFVNGAATYADYTPDEMQHKLRHGAEIAWAAGRSGGTPAFTVTLINGVSSYSSVS